MSIILKNILNIRCFKNIGYFNILYNFLFNNNIRIILLFSILTFTFNAKSQTWNKVANMNGYANLLKVIDNNLYIIGQYSSINGQTIKGISKWDGLHFEAIGEGFFNIWGSDFSIEKFNNIYYLGGGFIGLNNDYNIKYIAKYNNYSNNWEGFPSNPSSEVKYLKFRNKLYVGGRFQSIGASSYKYIASWNDTTWSSVGGGLTGDGTPSTGIYCMVEYMGDLIVAGSFGRMGTTNANNIARWDGSQWHALAGGVGGLVSSLCVDTVNNILYVGGGFFNADTTVVHCVAAWNGTNWYAPGQGITHGALAMTMFDNKLYVGGQLSTFAYEDTVLAYYDGINWTKVNGPRGDINALAVYNGNLYVGGNFDRINGDTTYKYLACYGDSCPDVVSTHNNLQAPNYKLRVFPNPTKDKFTINTSIPAGTVASLKVYSLNGILKKEIVLENENTTTTLDVSKWQKGTYTCSLIIDNKLVKSEKLVVN